MIYLGNKKNMSYVSLVSEILIQVTQQIVGPQSYFNNEDTSSPRHQITNFYYSMESIICYSVSGVLLFIVYHL